MKNFGAVLFIIATTVPLLAQPVVSESKSVDVDHLNVHYTNYGKATPRCFLCTAGPAMKPSGAIKRPR